MTSKDTTIASRVPGRAALFSFAAFVLSLCALSVLESAYWNDRLSPEAFERASARYLVSGELALRVSCDDAILPAALDDRLLDSASKYARFHGSDATTLQTIAVGLARWGVDSEKTHDALGIPAAETDCARYDYVEARFRDSLASLDAKDALNAMESADPSNDADLAAALDFLNALDPSSDEYHNEYENENHNGNDNGYDNRYGNRYGYEYRYRFHNENGNDNARVYLTTAAVEGSDPIDSVLVVSSDDIIPCEYAIYARRACEASSRLFFLLALGTLFYIPAASRISDSAFGVVYGVASIVRAIEEYLKRLNAASTRFLVMIRVYLVVNNRLLRNSNALDALESVRLLI